jgi:hypothetical protein
MEAVNVKWPHFAFEEGVSVYQLNTDICYGNYQRRLSGDYRGAQNGLAGKAR